MYVDVHASNLAARQSWYRPTNRAGGGEASGPGLSPKAERKGRGVGRFALEAGGLGPVPLAAGGGDLTTYQSHIQTRLSETFSLAPARPHPRSPVQRAVPEPHQPVA